MLPPNEPTKFTSKFRAFWKPFMAFFQMLCVSHFSIFRPNLRENRWKLFLFRVYFASFSILHLAIVFYVLGKVLFNMPVSDVDQSRHKENRLMYCINVMTNFSTLLSHMVSNLEPLFNGKCEEAIYQELQIIENILSTDLNHATNYKAKRAKYLRQTIPIFLLSILLATLSSFTPMPESYQEKYFIQPQFIFPEVIVRFRWCYIALFLSDIADKLDTLEILLTEQQKQSIAEKDNRHVAEKLKHFRTIYTHTWTTINLVSQCFGWSLICLLLDFVLEFILGWYWLYFNFKYYNSNGLSNRK